MDSGKTHLTSAREGALFPILTASNYLTFFEQFLKTTCFALDTG